MLQIVIFMIFEMLLKQSFVIMCYIFLGNASDMAQGITKSSVESSYLVQRPRWFHPIQLFDQWCDNTVFDHRFSKKLAEQPLLDQLDRKFGVENYATNFLNHSSTTTNHHLQSINNGVKTTDDDKDFCFTFDLADYKVCLAVCLVFVVAAHKWLKIYLNKSCI